MYEVGYARGLGKPVFGYTNEPSPYMQRCGELSPDASGANLITNSELWDILKPGSEARPYIYDQFTTWGELQWDPFSTQEDYSGPRVVPSTPFQDQQGHSPTRKEHHS